MPRYKYLAKSGPHQIVRSGLEAESELDAIRKLTAMGYYPISVEPEKIPSLHKHSVLRLHKISNRDTVLFARQLSDLIESGVNILHSLKIIADQTPNKNLKLILSDVMDKIKDGNALSDSLMQHPGLFPILYTSMIHSGEIGGTLDQTLKRLADFLEKEEEFRNALRAALSYPLFVLGVGALTVIIMLVFVIPKLVTMFTDMGQVLPMPTRILIGISAFLGSFWWLILAGAGILIFFLRRSRESPEGRMFWDGLKLKIKVFGGIALKTEVSRLMRTLSLLLTSGIPITSALDIAVSLVGNEVLKREVRKVKTGVTDGLSLSLCLRESVLFSPFVVSIVTVGEETGTLEKSLMRIADDYERETDRTLKTFSRLLEPAIILIIGLVVGFIVLSMLLPIFSINLIVR